jgi:8-oxo-dGTP pyrophosphatase MutT (NUDIX family)
MKLWIPRQREEPFFEQIVVKAILFNKQGQILLLRKPPSEWRKATKGYDLPGGKLEKMDDGDIDEALRREVNEETNLEFIRLTTEPASIEREKRSREGRILHIKKFPCFVDSTEELQLSEEHDYYGWLTPKQLRKIKFAKYSQLFIDAESIGCPPRKPEREWIKQWKDVPYQMIKDIEIAHRYWQEWMDRHS